jgi:hypothetical protein
MKNGKAEILLDVVTRIEEDLRLLSDWCEFESKVGHCG